MSGYSFTLPYPPSLNHLYRRVGSKTLISAQGRQYKADAAMTALAAGVRPLAGPVAVRVTLYRPQRRGDLDNTLKALMDCLNGIAWQDDGQIVELHAYRRDDKGDPRAEVTVAALTVKETPLDDPSTPA